MTTRTGSGLKLKVALLLATLLAGGAYVLYGTGVDTDRERGRVIRAEVESTGTFHVTLSSLSSFTGQTEHVDASYQRSFGWTIPVKRDERVEVFLTAALDIDRERRHQVECVLKENGNVVDRQSRVIRAGQPGNVVTCAWVTTG